LKGLWIRNANVYLPDRVLTGGSVYAVGGRIARICGPEDGPPAKPGDADEVWDAEGLSLVPGFVDVHVHGGGGADVMDRRTMTRPSGGSRGFTRCTGRRLSWPPR